MPNIPERFYRIGEHGIHRMTLVDEYIGPQIAILKRMAKHVPRIINNFTGNGISLSFSQTCFAIAGRIEQLELNTFFRPMVDIEEKVSLVPIWGAGLSNVKGSEMKFAWKPLEGMTLFFVAAWQLPSNDAAIMAIEPNFYLVARSEDKRTWLLPTPNLYEDGRICLGDPSMMGRPVMDQYNEGLKIFTETRWNADLLRQPVESQALFRFDPDGKQLPPLRPWTQLCHLINHTNYQFIATI